MLISSERLNEGGWPDRTQPPAVDSTGQELYDAMQADAEAAARAALGLPAPDGPPITSVVVEYEKLRFAVDFAMYTPEQQQTLREVVGKGDWGYLYMVWLGTVKVLTPKERAAFPRLGTSKNAQTDANTPAKDGSLAVDWPPHNGHSPLDRTPPIAVYQPPDELKRIEDIHRGLLTSTVAAIARVVGGGVTGDETALRVVVAPETLPPVLVNVVQPEGTKTAPTA